MIKALGKFGRPGKCPLLMPTGKYNRGRGGTVGAWRPRASASQTVIIDEEKWFSSHTPVLEGRDPTHEGSVHEV